MRLATMGNARAATLAALALAALSALPAAAEEPVETAVRAWVAAVDASPDWRASVGAIAVDPSTGRATVSELAVQAERPGFAVALESITVDAFRPTSDGTFAAGAIAIDNARMDAGGWSLRIDHASLDAPVLPSAAGFVWDDARPFASLTKALAPLLTASAAGVRAHTVALVETIGTVQSTTTYSNVNIEAVKNGTIARISAGPLRTDSPSQDPEATVQGPPPLVVMKATSAEMRDVDLAAMLAVYDVDRYAGGVGDGVWRTTVGHTVYRGIGFDVPGIAVNIAGVSIDDFRMRRPKTPPDFGAGPSTGTLPEVLQRLTILSAYGIGRLALRDLEVTGAGIDRLRLGDLSIVDASTDAIGSFTLENMEAAIGGQGAIKAARLAFGGLELPPLETLKAALEARVAGTDIDLSSLIPLLGYFETAGVSVGLSALPAMQLGRLRVDLGKYIDKIPTTANVALAGADIPASLIPDPRARQLLSSFGYDRVRLDGGVGIEWSEGGDITVRNASLGMKDVGAVSGEADLAGLTPADAAHIDTVPNALDKLSLKRGTFAFTDDSIVGRVLTAQAERLKTDPAKFRETFAKGLPFMLMFLGDKALLTELSPVLQTFIRTPGTITAVATPGAPVALSAILAAAKSAPFSLFGLLSVNVSGVAGPEPAPAPAETAPAEAPPIRSTIAPAN